MPRLSVKSVVLKAPSKLVTVQLPSGSQSVSLFKVLGRVIVDVLPAAFAQAAHIRFRIERELA